MTPKSLTREVMAARIGREIGMSSAQASGLVESVLRHLCKALSNGDTVKIPNFGTFRISWQAARAGRNPKTGEPAVIRARGRILFAPSQRMRGIVAKNPSEP